MLHARLFKSDRLLQACAVDHAAHVLQGHCGPHVGRLQVALLLLDTGVVDRLELLAQHFGPSTAAAVLQYKARRGIINRSYQTQPDNIVGVMTVTRMDAELLVMERNVPLTGSTVAPGADSAPAFALHRTAKGLMTSNTLRPKYAVNGFAASGGPAPSGVLLSGDGAESFRRWLAWAGGHGAAGMVGPVVPNELRSRIVERAREVMGVVGAVFANDYVRDCWSVTRTKGKSTPAPDPIKVHWCGIFATWVWSKVVPVEWVFSDMPEGVGNGPYRVGNATRVATSSTTSMIAPGDIVVKSRDPFHHSLVLAVSADGSTAEVLEGNSGNSSDPSKNRVGHSTNYRLPSAGAQTHYFYSVDSLREPSQHYGYNQPGHRG